MENETCKPKYEKFVPVLGGIVLGAIIGGAAVAAASCCKAQEYNPGEYYNN